jgi:MYXO-CTERM domain-containing protein
MLTALRALAASAVALTFASPALAYARAYHEAGGCVRAGNNNCNAVSDLGTVTSAAGSNVTVGATPTPFIKLENVGGYNNSSVYLRYSYRVLLESIANAPLFIDALTNNAGNWSISTSLGPSSVKAETGVFADLTGGTPQSYSHQSFGTESGNFSITGSVDLLETGYVFQGKTYDVYGGNLKITASSVAYGAGDVFIDPVITVSQSAAQAAGYTGQSLVQVPGGFGNGVSSSAPEPAEWALLIGGFALIGTARRRREFAL